MFHKTPVHSVWCAAFGASALPEENTYPNNCNSWMVCGPIDLSMTNWSILRFSFCLESELYQDYFYWLISIDGQNFYGEGISGSTDGEWLEQSQDLKNVYQLGDVTGVGNVWIAFVFQSNDSDTGRGVFLDDISLTIAQLDTLEILKSFATPASDGIGIAWDGQNLWHTDKGVDKIYKLDTDGNILSFFNSPGLNPAGLAWDGRYLWIADLDSRLFTLGILPVNDGLISANFPIESPYGLAYDSRKLLISDYEKNNLLYTLDPLSLEIDSILISNSSFSKIFGSLRLESYQLIPGENIVPRIFRQNFSDAYEPGKCMNHYRPNAELCKFQTFWFCETLVRVPYCHS